MVPSLNLFPRFEALQTLEVGGGLELEMGIGLGFQP